MALAPLPEEILERFRTSSRNRLSQVQATWRAFAQGLGTDEMAREMHRNVHTLKGDARMVQYHDIGLVCQKLEDLLSVANSRQYRVSEDFDLMVSMSFDFIGLLLRRRGDQEVGGIDLKGFVAQATRVLQEEHAAARGQEVSPWQDDLGIAAGDVEDTVSEQTRLRLGMAATKVFLEYLSASGAARTRLRAAWRELQHEIDHLDSAPLTPFVERYAHAANEVADGLGLRISIKLELDGHLRVSAEVLQALNVVLMHGLRNALSHGIETPELRLAAGKDPEGELALATSRDGDYALITLSDDGKGLDMEQIRTRAIATGTMHPDIARDASRSDLLELLFQQGFSTRDSADDVAGRGVGLDAARAALRKVGGDVHIDGLMRKGTTLSMRVPMARHQIGIRAFDAYGGRLVLAVSSQWEVSWHELESAGDPIDPVARLQIRRPEDDTGLVQPGTPRVIRLISDQKSLELIAVGTSRDLIADRICPTPESFPLEVVTVDGVEVLLIRPDRLPIPVPEENEW